MFRTRTISSVLSFCFVLRIGGEFDRVLEVNPLKYSKYQVIRINCVSNK